MFSKPKSSFQKPTTKSRQEIRRPQTAPRQTTYDDQTGQIYSETEVAFQKKHNTDWIGEHRSSDLIRRPRPNENGPRSLFDMAKIKSVKEFRDFTPEHFEVMPWSVAKQLWEEVVATRSESFHAWRTLASAYSQSEEFGQSQYRYYLEIKQPPLPAREYYAGLTSSEHKWVTALRISPRQVTVPDLIAVASIQNLAVLDLSDERLQLELRPAVFEERIMRTWAELAYERKAFTRLRVIMLGWQDAVSDWIFKYVNSFPSLCYIIVTDCKNLHQKNRGEWEDTAEEHGWEAQHAKKSVKTLRPLLIDENFNLGTVSNCYYQSLELATSSKPGEAKRHPVIECRIGTPRIWTHIVDEFPGTRTVWFENMKFLSRGEVMVSSEHIKRPRGDAAVPNAASLPPAKRTQEGVRLKRRIPKASAVNLLAEFGH